VAVARLGGGCAPLQGSPFASCGPVGYSLTAEPAETPSQLVMEPPLAASAPALPCAALCSAPFQALFTGAALTSTAYLPDQSLGGVPTSERGPRRHQRRDASSDRVQRHGRPPRR